MIQWVITAYVLTLSALILLSGALGDLLGRKRVFNAGIMLFTVGALAAGLAPSLEVLIAVRALQGCGAALMVPGSLAIINVTFPKAQRGRVIGLWAGVSGAIAALGPIIGGVLVELTWRLVFLAVVPIGVLALLTSLRFVPESRSRETGSIDWMGGALVLAALFGLSLALVQLPDWGLSYLTVAAGGGGLLLLALFLGWERRAAYPIVPYEMFTRHVFGANLATLLLYFAFQSVFFLLSFLLQQLLGLSSSVSGMMILPTTLVIATLSGPSGSITDRFGPRRQMIVGPLLVAAAAVLMLLLTNVEQHMLAFGGAALAVGVGMVTVIPAITKSALDVEERYSGAASGVNNALARVAGLIAVALQGALLVLLYRGALATELAGLSLSDAATAHLLSNAGELMGAPMPPGLGDALQERVVAAQRGALADAFRGAFAVVAVASGVTAVVSRFTIAEKKD
jgi:EmrB/QacA subfamily drug resistance transporter